MKKTLLLPLVLICSLSTVVHAEEVGCVADGKEITVKAGEFVKQTFPVKCSANVHSAYDQNANAFAVSAGSQKGKNVFGGSTAGGSVKNIGDPCTASTGCTADQVKGKAAGLLTGDGST